MTTEIVLLDLFSGIGGFAKGIEAAGFIIKKHYFSEIEKHAIANYQYNFKNAEYVGAIQNVRGASLGKVDVITFGSPCQDFSIAGKREGLDGKRSSLILEAIKIIIEKKPTFFIWENVKGTFSSNNGEDFFAILQEFANIRGYNIEWQLLNTLWVLPQNRERIYLVGHLATAGTSFKPIFPFTKNDRLFNVQKGTKGKRSQAQHCTTITKAGNDKATNTYIESVNSSQDGKVFDINGACQTLSSGHYNVPKIAGALSGGGNSGGLHSDMTVINAYYFSKAQQDRVYHTDGAMGCLGSNRTDNKTKIFTPKREYRRLTEIECERLQGFPDNWTQFGIYEKQVWINKKEKTFKIVEGIEPIAPTNRYKLIGNAVTKRFPQMIAQKLIENYSL